MYVRVNGGRYCTKTGMLEVKRRFGAGAVLVSYDEERPCIAPVDALGRFLVHDGCSYDVYSLQTGDARCMASLASEREARLSQRDTLASQEPSRQRQERKRSRSDAPKTSRRKGNYVRFVQSFLKGFLSVSFADAAKEWRLFPEELKRTAHVDVLLERVRAKGVYEPVLA
ncbi:uncharacterized protein Tco025E_01733 [Trypanosoma conorhini]|uniref:Uncharacterized protein n=1 Tax=Trypanosoma conorhini TaxID=83891 RepID=A0A3R7NYZ0_9TRYP|nr:uncharacterized protein Tco025E_01733 [Trypanosoma conorhini]RNF26028.1 hypothetical protein Tco025E_01733 [Trypanosoma conorhini]